VTLAFYTDIQIGKRFHFAFGVRRADTLVYLKFAYSAFWALLMFAIDLLHSHFCHDMFDFQIGAEQNGDSTNRDYNSRNAAVQGRSEVEVQRAYGRFQPTRRAPYRFCG
jgi:hypothetical protein